MHQCKEAISIKNIGSNKIVVSNKFFFSKKGFKYIIGYKDAKKLDLYIRFFQTLVHIEKTLIRLNICRFW